MTSENCCCKKWCCRKRTWLLVAIVLLVYFCLVPSRFQATYETTGLRNPIVKNGKVDYFGAYEATYVDQFVPPEQNGMRDIIAALGPVVLEQLAMVDAVPWDEMPSNENSKNWFETYWVPLCQHMSIDPYKKPRFYDKRGFYSTMYKLKQAKKAAAGDAPFEDDDPTDQKLWEKVVNSPWKAEDEPIVAAWLADFSPVLDLYGHAVRKPNYACWRKSAGELFCILLPDVQSQRDFARNARIRVTERLGRGDIDGAWYDVMSMLYLARHYKKDVIIVTNLVGIAIQDQAMEAAKLILLHPTIDDNHLRKFAADLESLPPNTFTPIISPFEKLMSFDAIPLVASGEYLETVQGSWKEDRAMQFKVFKWLPIDYNIAGKRLTQLWQQVDDGSWMRTPALAKRLAYEDRILEQVNSLRLGLSWFALRLPLIHTRSQLAAELTFRDLTPAFEAAQRAFNRSTAYDEMLRTAIAILRYKNAHNDYPETLDSLVPEFLEMYPLDPFTGRANFVYKREPGELASGAPTPFRLYSVGQNGIDDGGVQKQNSTTAFNSLAIIDEVFF